MTATIPIIENHPPGWDTVVLGSICTINQGSTQLAKLPSGRSGVPIIAATRIIDGRIILDKADHASEETANRYPNHRIRPCDLIMRRHGDDRRHALATGEHDGALLDSSCFRLRVDNQVLARYLNHYLNHPAVQEWLAHETRQGVVANIRKSNGGLESLPVLLPPADDQRDIVHLFRTMDEKMRTHEQIITATRVLRQRLIEPVLEYGCGGS